MSPRESIAAGPDFEAASDALIDHVVRLTKEHLGKDPGTKNASVSRASVHLIASDGWRQLAASEWSAAPRDPRTQSEVRRSSTLWSLIRRFHCPVGVTVLTKAIDLYRAKGVEKTTSNELEDFDAGMTMVKGTATHALAIPIAPNGEVVEGMVAIEVIHTRRLVDEIEWGTFPSALLREVAQSADVLLSKPARRTRAVELSSGDVDWSNDASDLARVFGPLKDHILIRGPTGVGKTYLARQIHEISGRTGRFIPYNALSYPNDLQVAYLLGWKEYAFTGAHTRTKGAIAEAEGGTIFIDEVDKLSPRAQIQLMMLTDKNAQYAPLGEVVPRPVGDVRFVFATNADLEQMVESGDFRHDLHFRINVFPISIASISERRHEIPGWCESLLAEIHAEANIDRIGSEPNRRCSISPEAIAIARGRSWPGNLRQLGTILKRAYAVASLRGGDVIVGSSDMKRALAMDVRMTGIALLRQLESIAQKVAEITEHQLSDWAPPSDTKARDEENPGLAALIGSEDPLFPMVWKEMERMFPYLKTSQIAALVARETAYERNNYSKQKSEAFRSVERIRDALSTIR